MLFQWYYIYFETYSMLGFSHRNSLNLQLQGRENTVCDLFETERAFQSSLEIFQTDLSHCIIPYCLLLLWKKALWKWCKSSWRILWTVFKCNSRISRFQTMFFCLFVIYLWPLLMGLSLLKKKNLISLIKVHFSWKWSGFRVPISRRQHSGK